MLKYMYQFFWHNGNDNGEMDASITTDIDILATMNPSLIEISMLPQQSCKKWPTEEMLQESGSNFEPKLSKFSRLHTHTRQQSQAAPTRDYSEYSCQNRQQNPKMS